MHVPPGPVGSGSSGSSGSSAFARPTRALALTLALPLSLPTALTVDCGGVTAADRRPREPGEDYESALWPLPGGAAEATIHGLRRADGGVGDAAIDEDVAVTLGPIDASFPSGGQSHVLRGLIDPALRCYARALQRDPAQAGRVELVLVIDAAGLVTRADAAPLGVDERLARCVSDAARGLGFAQEPGVPFRQLATTVRFELRRPE